MKISSAIPSNSHITHRKTGKIIQHIKSNLCDNIIELMKSNIENSNYELHKSPGDGHCLIHLVLFGLKSVGVTIEKQNGE